MITEDYVSFETAKLLKEKGFDVNCYTHYSSDGQNVYYNYQTPSDGINMPTLQMAMKWLRKVKNCTIAIIPEWFTPYGCAYAYSIWVDDNLVIDGVADTDNDTEYDTYEKACEAAIKYCLENLI